MFVLLPACWLLNGCTMLDTAAPTASQPAALSWLTNWVSQPIEMAAGFDVEVIRPESRPALVGPDNLLEITVWDLYEPGKPYTFPVRVSARQTIEAPFVGEVPVEGRTIAQVETALAGAFRKGDYLLNPRVLVRSLDAPVLKVQVNGAVHRGGFVELTRTDPSVYAAIVSAGGLKKTAGTQVGVTRRIATAVPPLASVSAEPKPRSAPVDEPVASDGPGEESRQPHTPELRVNSVDELSVPPVIRGGRPADSNRALFAVDAASVSRLPLQAAPPGGGSFSSANEPLSQSARLSRDVPAQLEGAEQAVWYDVSLAHDRDQLKLLQLSDGDVVTVKEATPPLRIGGIVENPGAYPLPPGRSVDVWQAIEMAGGIRGENVPLNINLLRPAGEGRTARRWYLHVAAYDEHPAASPAVEPGDVLHVEPTTGSKIKRAVGGWWNKP